MAPKLRETKLPFQSYLTQAWTTHDANVALYSALSQPCSFNANPRPSLPPELILQILEHPTRLMLTSYVTMTVPGEGPLRIYSSSSPLRILSSPPLSADDAKNIRKIVFEFTGKDQGWSSFSSDHGTYNNTWSWYEANVRNRSVKGDQTPVVEGRFELQRNRHAGQGLETYRIEMEKEHPLLEGLRQGDVIELVACAAFPGWECQFKSARIEVWTVDTLEMGEEMEWIEYPSNSMLSGRWVDKASANGLKTRTGDFC